jgi:hypothetical protein
MEREMSRRTTVGETTVSETITIGERFCGPAGCGNGGYTCGTVAAYVNANPAVVRLRAPVPLGHALDIVRRPDGEVEVTNGENVLARARPAQHEVEVEVPEAPSIAELDAAMARYEGHHRHPFPTCFVCGTEREPGDGLRLFTGPVEGRQMVGSTWTPDASLAGTDGPIDPVFVWASLDCPSGWASLLLGDTTMRVLGEITAQIDGLPEVGESCVVMGWPIRREGERKTYVGSALVSESGKVYGRAQALWLRIQSAPRASSGQIRGG